MYTIGALAVIGTAGFALDLGLAYLTKTRMQNAVDAAALAAARVLFVTGSTAQATAVGTDAFSSNVAGLTPAITVTPALTFSDQQSPFAAGGANPRYVRVAANGVSLSTYLIQVMGIGTMTLNATAMAGPVGTTGEICGALPLALCGTNNGDTDCSDGSCFGLSMNSGTTVQSGNKIGPGNFGLMELGCGTGADCVRSGMAGGEEACFTPGSTLGTEPGKKSGPVSQGLNTRFNNYLGGGGLNATDHPPDVVIDGPLTHAQYEARLADSSSWDIPDGVPGRRIAVVPVIDCGAQISGRTTVTVLGQGCVFLTDLSSNGDVNAQLIPTCTVSGGTPSGGGVTSGARIVLFQDGVAG